MAKSDYLENAVLNWLRGTTFPAAPTSLFVALSTADPGDDGAGLAEPAGGGYARLEVEGATGRDFTAPADNAGAQQIKNAGEWAFPTASASWGTITHVAIMDAVSGGNLLYHVALTTPKAADNGDTLKFAANALTFSES